jgi:hypothetical protein
LDDELHALRHPGRGDAKQVADVDYTEAPYLHVMASQFRTGADQVGLAAPPHLHRVVGNQAVAADDQIQRTLALADAAVAGDQHAQTEDIHENAMNDLTYRQQVLEQDVDLCDGGWCGDDGAQQRNVEALTSGEQLRRWIPPARNEHAWNVVGERRRQYVEQRIGVERVEVANLAFAKYQHPPRLQVLVKSGEGETGLLDVRAGDRARGALLPAQQFEWQADRFGAALKQAGNRELRLHDDSG